MDTLSHRLWTWLKTAYLRITLNRVTTLFFLFSVVFCFLQSSTQAALYTFDDNWYAVVAEITGAAGLGSTTFVQYTGDYSLEMCTNVSASGAADCMPLFRHAHASEVSVSHSSVSSRGRHQAAQEHGSEQINWMSEQGLPVGDLTVQNGTNGDVIVTASAAQVELSQTCVETLLYPKQKFEEFSKEKLVQLAAQFWLLCLCLCILACESIPHIIALMFSRVLITIMSAYSIRRTTMMATRLRVLIGSTDSPCHFDMFSDYLRIRVIIQIPNLVFNVVALVLLGCLSLRLLKLYSTKTFSYVGPPTDIIKSYVYLVAVLVCLQLSLFLLVVAMGLWIDQLMNGPIRDLSWHTRSYMAIFISSTVLLIPWITMGWFSARREKKPMMIAFLLVGSLLIAGWSVMFYSMIYRFTFVDWPFFGSVTVASFIFMILSMVFGLACRTNFGKGLMDYLDADMHMARANAEPDVFEHQFSKKWTEEDEEAADRPFSFPPLPSESQSIR